MDTNIEVVVPIMLRLTPEERADVIGAMGVEKGAIILRLTVPEGL
jgi:hypothetical protein